MRTSLKILTVATALIVGIAAAPAIYAQSTGTTTAPMMDKGKMPMGQMGEGNMPMGQKGQMGEGNMPMGQGNMMAMMKQMMKKHNGMMETMMKDHAGEKTEKTQ